MNNKLFFYRNMVYIIYFALLFAVINFIYPVYNQSGSFKNPILLIASWMPLIIYMLLLVNYYIILLNPKYNYLHKYIYIDVLVLTSSLVEVFVLKIVQQDVLNIIFVFCVFIELFLQKYLYRHLHNIDIKDEYEKMCKFFQKCESCQICDGKVINRDRFFIYWIICVFVGVVPFNKYVMYILAFCLLLIMKWLFNNFFILCNQFNFRMSCVKKSCYINFISSLLISCLLYPYISNGLVMIILWGGVFTKYIWKYKISQIIYKNMNW